MADDARSLIEKITALPAEVEDFVDFLHSREQDRALVRAAAAASGPSFAAVWDDPEDSVYDRL